MLDSLDRLLFSPSRKISDSQERFRARVVTILITAHLVSQIADGIFLSIYNYQIPGYEAKSAATGLAFGLFVNTFAYLASRTTHFRLACYINMTSVTSGLLLAAFFNPDTNLLINALPWLLNNTLMAGTVLSNRETVGVAILSITIGYCIKFIAPNVNVAHIYMILHYISSLSVIAVLAAILRNRAERLAHQRQSMLFQASKLTALGEMAGGIAHELNTPLATIRLLAEYIRKRLSDPSESARLDSISKAEKIMEVTRRVADLVTSVRAISGNPPPTHFEPISLRQVFENTLSLCHQRFVHSNIQFMIDPPSIPVEVILICNPVQIVHVLLNLLNNAFDAVQEVDNRWIKLEWQLQSDTLVIAITDSGRGVAPHLRKKLFQPFFTTKPVGKGTGIGLSISKTILEQHGGMIYYDPTFKNTRFVAVIPINPDVKKSSLSGKAPKKDSKSAA